MNRLHLGALLFAAAACGPARYYEGPRRAESETAQLTVRYGGERVPRAGKVRYDAWIVKVDGESAGWSLAAIVLPGAHELELGYQRLEGRLGAHGAYWDSYAKKTMSVAFDAEAGKRYRIEWAAFPEDAGSPPVVRVVPQSG